MVHISNIETIAGSKELFENFDSDDMHCINNLLVRLNLPKGKFLFHEGMPATNLYIIKEGKVSIVKEGFEISVLESGQYIGEIAVVDKQMRSASAQAQEDSVFYILPLDKLQENSSVYSKLLLNISKTIARRLRESNTAVVSAFKKELDALKLQMSVGRLISYILAAMALYLIGFRFIVSFWNEQGVTLNGIAARVNIILALVVLIIIRKSGYPLSSYGLNTHQWKKSIVESVLYSLPILAIVALLALFPWFISLQDHLNVNTYGSLYWLNLIIGYVLFAPIGEFIARGCLQESLQRFLLGRHAKYKAIIIASLLYSSTYSYMSPVTPVLMFVLGLFWGWLYARHKTLIGVSISHILIGIGINFIGFPIYLV